MPALSVIIPVYKVEPYIARCVRSLFGQTLEDIEYIFVDDCTPDRSMEIMSEVLEEYPQRKGQVKCIRTPQNGGLARARLAGVALAQGTYIIHCDSDDEVETDAYRLMYEKAVAEDLDIVSCDFRLVGLKKPRIQSQASKPGRELADILSGKVWGTVWSRLFKRELWDGIVLPRGDMWEDIVFSVQAISKARRFGNVDIPLYIYCRRQSSISFEEGLNSAVKRWEAISQNSRQVLDVIGQMSDWKVKQCDIVAFKYKARAPLIPYVHIPEYYRKWRGTYPEIDSVLLLTRGIPVDTKFWFVLIHLHLFRPWKTVTGLFRRMIKANS